MKFMIYLFSIVYGVGYLGNAVLFVFGCYHMMTSWISLINPFFYFTVIYFIIFQKWFYIFLAITIFGYFSMHGAYSMMDKENIRADD